MAQSDPLIYLAQAQNGGNNTKAASQLKEADPHPGALRQRSGAPGSGDSSIPAAQRWVTRGSDHKLFQRKGMGNPQEQKRKGKSPIKRIHFPSL